jgi:mono/diheme cytochrome c family protein
MWRPPITAHLLRSFGGGLGDLLRSLPLDGAGEARARSGNSRTVVAGRGRAGVVRLLGCAGFAASLALAASIQPAWAQGDAKAGKAVYDLKCSGCHGVKGDGKGPAAELLLPAPRDFTSGIYKIRTTANKTPTDQDLFRIISDGMPGTSMPAWAVLPEKDRWNLVAYIKTFAGDKLSEAPKKLELPKEVGSSDASIKRGKEMYEAIECHKCHGNDGRADGPSRAEL